MKNKKNNIKKCHILRDTIQIVKIKIIYNKNKKNSNNKYESNKQIKCNIMEK